MNWMRLTARAIRLFSAIRPGRVRPVRVTILCISKQIHSYKLAMLPKMDYPDDQSIETVISLPSKLWISTGRERERGWGWGRGGMTGNAPISLRNASYHFPTQFQTGKLIHFYSNSVRSNDYHAALGQWHQRFEHSSKCIQLSIKLRHQGLGAHFSWWLSIQSEN